MRYVRFAGIESIWGIDILKSDGNKFHIMVMCVDDFHSRSQLLQLRKDLVKRKIDIVNCTSWMRSLSTRHCLIQFFDPDKKHYRDYTADYAYGFTPADTKKLTRGKTKSEPQIDICTLVCQLEEGE